MEPVSERWARRKDASRDPEEGGGEGPECPGPGRPAYRDPREAEPWFQKLDVVTQELFRMEWRHDAINTRRSEHFQRESKLRGPIEGAVVFFVCHTVFAPLWMSWLRTLLAILVGAAVGRFWYQIRAGRARSITTGLVAHGLLVLAFSSDGGALMLFIQLFLSSCAFITLAGFAGTGREFRRREGTEV